MDPLLPSTWYNISYKELQNEQVMCILYFVLLYVILYMFFVYIINKMYYVLRNLQVC